MKCTFAKSFSGLSSHPCWPLRCPGIYAIADGFFVGNAMGDDALAAVNIAYPLTAFLQAVGTGIGMGGAIEYAINAGNQNENRGRQYMGMAILLLGGFSILFTALFLFAGSQIWVCSARPRDTGVQQRVPALCQLWGGIPDRGNWPGSFHPQHGRSGHGHGGPW